MLLADVTNLRAKPKKFFFCFLKIAIFEVMGHFLQNCYLMVKTSNEITDQWYFMMFFSETTIYTYK